MKHRRTKWGQAFDRDGNVLGEAYGDTEREVFEKLRSTFKDAYEIRVRTLETELAPASAESFGLRPEMQPVVDELRQRMKDAADDGSDKPLGFQTPDGELEVRDDGQGPHYVETELGRHQRWMRQAPDLFEKYQEVLARLHQLESER